MAAAAIAARERQPERKEPMPALLWISVQTADPDAEVIASRVSFRSHRDVPRLLERWLVRRRLVKSPGLVGYSLRAQLLATTFWTVSAWKGSPDLGRFARSGAHEAAKDALRPGMLPSTSLMWRSRVGGLPISWLNVRDRIEGASAAVAAS
jgi:hypothetical protein